MLLRFNVFGRECVLSFDSRLKKKKKVHGVTNRCQDGKYVIFLDYDNIELDWLIDEIKSLQNRFKIGNVMIFESSLNHYHAVCLEKYTRQEYELILDNSSVDKDYRRVPFIYGKRLATLRFSEKNGQKPRFILTLEGVNNDRLYSSAHISFFNTYDIYYDAKKGDGMDKLIMAEYCI